MEKKTVKKAYNFMKDVYVEEAQEAFPEELLEPLDPADITMDMLFHCYDSLEDALNYNLLFTDDKTHYRLMNLFISHVRELAQAAMDAELITDITANGEHMDIKEASKLVQDFLNGSWIKTLMVVRPGMLRTSSQNSPETYGIYDKRKNTAAASLEDDKAFMYMNRTNAVSGWFARELGNYSNYLKGLAGATDDRESDNMAYIADLLSGIAMSGDCATERDWAEGSSVNVTFTGVNLPGVALRIEPIQFTVAETKYMASQIAALNELANKAEGICVTPESLLFGKEIEVNLTAVNAKFSNTQEFKQYDLSLVNIDRPAKDLVDQIKGVLAKPEDERPDLVTGLFYGVPWFR